MHSFRDLMLNLERCFGMATKSFKVSVTEAQGWFVEQQVRLGRYTNISEVVRDGLRRLEAEAAQRDIDEFNRAFSGAHDSGASYLPTELRSC